MHLASEIDGGDDPTAGHAVTGPEQHLPEQHLPEQDRPGQPSTPAAAPGVVGAS
ncbi:MAG TPA: hypothetical protein VFE65_37035 [Pseudonocardia sp.]|nr:hypothetical protein [Pseudonocardia sp.]